VTREHWFPYLDRSRLIQRRIYPERSSNKIISEYSLLFIIVLFNTDSILYIFAAYKLLLKGRTGSLNSKIKCDRIAEVIYRRYLNKIGFCLNKIVYIETTDRKYHVQVWEINRKNDTPNVWLILAKNAYVCSFHRTFT